MSFLDFIPLFIFIVTVFSGVCGFYTAKKQKSSRFWGIVGVFAWGGLLTSFMLSMGVVLFAFISCATVNGNGMSPDSCNHRTFIWYSVIKQWETGIGASIGLLGVAWSTFYNSVYGAKANA